ncbi:MAG: hypothetical protein ACR2NX_11175, partial [Chthoniobacterales bacterium]
MKKIIISVGAAAVILFLGYCGWQHFSGGDGGQTQKQEPTAQVQVAPLQRKSISQKLTAYGSVVAQPGKTHSVSVAFETRVIHVLVAPGEFVHD